MAANNNERARQLRRLAEYHKSAASGYDTAVNNVELSEYSDLFRGYQKQHADFADRLEEHATTLEGAPEEIEEVELAGLYEELDRLEGNVSETDLDGLIAETRRIEDELLEQYQDAMEAEWEPGLHDAISGQFASLQRSREDLRPR